MSHTMCDFHSMFYLLHVHVIHAIAHYVGVFAADDSPLSWAPVRRFISVNKYFTDT